MIKKKLWKWLKMEFLEKVWCNQWKDILHVVMYWTDIERLQLKFRRQFIWLLGLKWSDITILRKNYFKTHYLFSPIKAVAYWCHYIVFLWKIWIENGCSISILSIPLICFTWKIASVMEKTRFLMILFPKSFFASHLLLKCYKVFLVFKVCIQVHFLSYLAMPLKLFETL